MNLAAGANAHLTTYASGHPEWRVDADCELPAAACATHNTQCSCSLTPWAPACRAEHRAAIQHRAGRRGRHVPVVSMLPGACSTARGACEDASMLTHHCVDGPP